MKSKSKVNLQSGAIVTFLNGLFYKFIQLTSCHESVKDILVYISTPLSLLLAWGVLIFVKVFGDLKAADILLNRATTKGIIKARNIINNADTTRTEKEEAEKDLKSLLNFQRKNRNKQLNKLAVASEQAQSSTDFLNTTNTK